MVNENVQVTNQMKAHKLKREQLIHIVDFWPEGKL